MDDRVMMRIRCKGGILLWIRVPPVHMLVFLLAPIWHNTVCSRRLSPASTIRYLGVLRAIAWELQSIDHDCDSTVLKNQDLLVGKANKRDFLTTKTELKLGVSLGSMSSK